MGETPALSHAGRSDLARGAAALIVMAAGIVVAATHDGTPVSKAATTLVAMKDADIVSPSGDTRAAVVGEQVASGDVVTTGPRGYAQLLTRGRLVLLSSNAALEVTSGDHQQLRTGTAVVDALRGAGLSLDLAGATVNIPVGSATEASRGASVRIGSLAGPAQVNSSNGRELALPRLKQVVINGDALPSSNTPLHLVDSDDEARVVPRLVADDLSLKTLARGIDTTGSSTAHVIEASWSGVSQPIVARSVRSERVLPVLIAKATQGGDVQQRYDDAVAWRAQGGSWGVVLHLLDGRAAQVEATLASLQKSTQTPGQVGTVIPAAIVGTVTTHHHSTAPQVGGGTTYPVGSHSPGTSTPTPSGGSPAAPPSPNLLGSLVSTLQSVIDGVLNLLPHDGSAVSTHETTKQATGLAGALTGSKRASEATTETTATRKSSTKATPAPAATPTEGLLGNLLGGLLKPLNHH
jgi:hypothetical protein